MTEHERQLRAVIKYQIGNIKEFILEPAGTAIVTSKGADNIVRLITENSPPHGYIFPNIRKAYYKAMKDKIDEYGS